MSKKPLIGVLAVQGDFEAHKKMLDQLGAESIEVRQPVDMSEIDGLIMPGGESTTMLKFLADEGLDEAITNFATKGKPVFGTCAGAILLAREVTGPAQASLALIDISVERNAYGRQVDSFIKSVDTEIGEDPLEAVFIRAPKIRRIGSNVEVIASLGDEPVLVSEQNILAATFHPELTGDLRVHKLFVDRVTHSGLITALEATNELSEVGRH